MKRIIILSLLFFISSLVFAGAILEKFQGRSQNDKVILEWKTRDEINVKVFVIERKTVGGEYIPLTEISPKGSNSFYQFFDETAFKSTGSVYYYRLKIVDNDGTVSYSNEISIVHSVSSVKRTWGSIKAMFR